MKISLLSQVFKTVIVPASALCLLWAIVSKCNGETVSIGLSPCEHSESFIGRVDEAATCDRAFPETQFAYIFNDVITHTV